MNHTMTTEKSNGLIEPHTLPPAEDHAHWLKIYDQQAHCVKGLKVTGSRQTSTFTRFFARCKICGGEDRWGVTNPTEDFAPARIVPIGSLVGAE